MLVLCRLVYSFFFVVTTVICFVVKTPIFLGKLQSIHILISMLKAEDAFRLLFAFFLDIDECITGNHDCDVNANCTNTVGGHNCTCKEGFYGDGRSCSG